MTPASADPPAPRDLSPYIAGAEMGGDMMSAATARFSRALLVVIIGAALFLGIQPLLDALHAYPHVKPLLGLYPTYKLYIGLEFLLALIAVMAMWRAGIPKALDELGIASLSPLGCAVCLAAIAAAFVVLLFAGAAWTPQPIVSLLLFGVFGPFVEEMICRGFLFRQMRRWAGVPFWLAALISSLIFGAAHFDQGSSLSDSVMNSAITFGGGFLFCWLVERWNSIWPGLVIHAGLNLLWSVYTLGDNAVGGQMGNAARLVTIVVALAGTFALSRRPTT